MDRLISISRQLAQNAKELKFGPPVDYIYNPLEYAAAPHEQFLKKYGNGKKTVLLVGMNPGPFGMAQTGIPFGDVKMVKEFLHIKDNVLKPDIMHPKRPVDGFSCRRSEVSGTRLWTWVSTRFKTAENFFKKFWIANYCPLVFMAESGKNITPDKLQKNERDHLFRICDMALKETALAVNARAVVGIGTFAEKRCLNVAKEIDIATGKILHPSPANPLANRGWAQKAEEQLASLGLL
jgi:single-strand selective monofunctional uracil DNA glycosylase